MFLWSVIRGEGVFVLEEYWGFFNFFFVLGDMFVFFYI